MANGSLTNWFYGDSTCIDQLSDNLELDKIDGHCDRYTSAVTYSIHLYSIHLVCIHLYSMLLVGCNSSCYFSVASYDFAVAPICIDSALCYLTTLLPIYLFISIYLIYFICLFLFILINKILISLPQRILSPHYKE